MGPQIIKILHVLFTKQKIKKEKDPKEKGNKRPGACLQNLPGVVPYLAVATRAVAPSRTRPPRAAPRVNKAQSKLLAPRPRSSLAPASSLTLCVPRELETLEMAPPPIAVAPRRH